MIYLGADHRGFGLKNKLKTRLENEGFEVSDLGNDRLDPLDDYVDFAHQVAEAVVQSPENRGIVLCGSGVGVDIVANKVDGIRSALVQDDKMAASARNDDDANVLALPADLLDEESSYKIAKVFLTTAYSGEPRFERRLEKLEKVEETHK